MSRFAVALCCLAVSAGASDIVRHAKVDSELGELILFVRPDASELARTFTRAHQPALRALASEMGIPLRVINVGYAGAPPDVTLTPLIAFQNYRGRSFYVGRYTTLDRIRNFVRTSRQIPLDNRPTERSDIPTFQWGRSRIAAPLKISPVSGHTPDDYRHDRFEPQARRALALGFSRFQLTPHVRLRRNDRLFYMDFNPWQSPDGTLFLSLSLFSQFHCHKPIFTQPGEALTAAWSDRFRLFERAAARMEQAVLQAMSQSELGDGFDPVPGDIKVASWESLSLPLPPPPPASASRPAPDIAIARHWTLPARAAGAPPNLSFRFPPPSDHYAGEVGRVTGELHLDADGGLHGASGFFEADPGSVIMGEPDLDRALKGSAFLNVARFPVSRFDIRALDVSADRLRFGAMASGRMQGTFQLKGVSVPLSVAVDMEPMIDDFGRPILSLRGDFRLELRPFGLEGPGGETGVDDYLLFHFDFAFRAAAP